MISRKYFKLIIISILSFSIAGLLYAQTSKWELEKNEEGIKVYTRSVDGYDLKEYKGETVFNASIDKIVKTLKDVKNMPKWVPDLEEAKLLSLKGDDQYHYTENHVPFPMDNRDAIVHYKYTKVENGVKVIITGKPKYIPEDEDLVRVPYIKGYWLFKKIKDNKTSVVYQVHIDPGGSIPAWMANSKVVSTPFNTLKNLRDYLKK